MEIFNDREKIAQINKMISRAIYEVASPSFIVKVIAICILSWLGYNMDKKRTYDAPVDKLNNLILEVSSPKDAKEVGPVHEMRRGGALVLSRQYLFFGSSESIVDFFKNCLAKDRWKLVRKVTSGGSSDHAKFCKNGLSLSIDFANGMNGNYYTVRAGWSKEHGNSYYCPS